MVAKLVCEFLGTFWLVLGGCGSAVLAAAFPTQTPITVSEARMEPFAYGLRSPNGINFSPEGDLFYCDNQGEWVISNKMHHVKQGKFFGHQANKQSGDFFCIHSVFFWYI